MRKLSFIIIFLVLLAPLFSATPASAAKSYFAERFDVQIDIQEDGSALITETVEFHFSGDPFTFAFREISATETDGLTFLDASMDGVPMSQGTRAGQVEVETGRPLKVTWHFPPTSDAVRVFTVRYLAEGVIRKGEGDSLIWRAIPEEHDYSIAQSTITLTYPSEATLLEAPTLNRTFNTSTAENPITLTSNGLDDDEDLILTARFSANSLTTGTPQWQLQQERRDAATARALPLGFISGIGTLLLGSMGLWIFARANGRELNISPVVSTANPPSNLSPALVGKLTKQPHAFMGTLFDLAQRGVLEVREEKGLWGMTKQHVLIRKPNAVSLQPYEQALLDALFKPTESEIKMNEIATRFGAKSKLFDELLEQALIQRGWLDPERKQKGRWLSGVGILMMLLALVIFLLSVIAGNGQLSEDSGWLPLIAALAGIGVGGFVLSIPMLIYAGAYSILTPAGEEQSARWKGFANYLKQVSKGREAAIRSDTFEKYLAYAATFGLGANWAKYFQDLGGVSLPVWFHATAGSDGDFGAMVAVMYASDSSGAGDGGGGGAGASGGGASGAG